MNRRDFLSATFGTGLLRAQSRRPNIILILADDLGYSDLGCYGGEIATPHLDKLAAGGMRFTQFYTSARCCPSRASLMTGRHPHQSGMGNMTGGSSTLDGYTGKMDPRAVMMPRVLREAGYSTLMCGKWHLGKPDPTDWGFDEFYGMLHGFDSFWDASKYTRLPAGRTKREYANFYATNAITDHALDFVTAARKSAKPYFLYLAYNAPHFPLHAPKELIDKYVPVYEKGWDSIREKRFARQRELGIVGKNARLTPRSVVGPNRVSSVNGWAERPNPAWDTIEPARRADLARRMAIFAAMVDTMDRNIGRLIADLKANGEIDNTVIFFLSDNGACAEWDPWGFDLRSGPDNVLHQGEQLQRMGQPGTYHSYGSGWANACNTPWRLYKHYMHEGGISTPLIAHWPPHIKAGSFCNEPGHLIDLMPTVAAIAGANPPAEVEGVSVEPSLKGKKRNRPPLFWEHEGNRAMRDGKWKLVALGAAGPWELYDMERDRAELNNIAAKYPQRVRAMAEQWERWAKRTHALPWIWKPQY